MEHLRDVEELLAPDHDLPVALQPDVAHQRHERVEDLGDAAAHRGRVDVQDPLALERLGQLVDLFDQCLAGEVPVVAKGFVPDANGL